MQQQQKQRIVLLATSSVAQAAAAAAAAPPPVALQRRWPRQVSFSYILLPPASTALKFKNICSAAFISKSSKQILRFMRFVWYIWFKPAAADACKCLRRTPA
jgi:hypothetical protein